MNTKSVKSLLTELNGIIKNIIRMLTKSRKVQ